MSPSPAKPPARGESCGAVEGGPGALGRGSGLGERLGLAAGRPDRLAERDDGPCPPRIARCSNVSRPRWTLAMKPSTFLINAARGGLVDEAALYEALTAGRIAGAGLDVFAVEPLPAGSPLRQLSNVLLSPHCAGGSIEAVVAMTNRCVDDILAIRDGRRLGEDLLNPEGHAG